MGTHSSYTKFERRCQGPSSRGFRLYPKRFSVQKLSARFVYIFRLLSKWRCSYGQALLRSLKRGIVVMNRSNSNMKRNNSSGRRNSATTELISGSNKKASPRVDTSRLRSFGRTNSFYSEAIAECLEFIKRSSTSVEQDQVCSSSQRSTYA